jgi:hypothetical protein
MENYQLKQLQTGEYIKVVDGETVGEATPGEVRCYFLQKKFPSVEAGFLEVALALAGVTGIISTISESRVIQVFSVAAFFFSVIGAYNLTWLYIQPRLPFTWTHYLSSPFRQRYPWFPLALWLLIYFIKQAVRLSLSSKDAEDRLLETSYLVLLTAVVLAGLALTIFVLLELFATFSSG